MLIINFDKNELCKKAYGLWQYDYGQVLRIQGLNLPTAAEIHFALQETGGEAVTRIGITKDGVTDVTIPDSLLEADGASQDYQIYVFVYLASPESGETTRRITLGVKSRPRPEAFNTPGEGELFEEAIQAVNDAAKRAEDAGKEASVAAGEARESASQAGKYLTDTQVLAEQVEINADAVAQGKEEAARLLTQTQEAASNAALSAETAKQSETVAKQAQTAAETAEDAARQYAEETEADRREVAESKQSVEQMQSDVARMQADVQADKEAVEQTVSEFGQTAQNALTAIGQAQNTAVSSVTEEGQKQATAVQETGVQAVNEVDTAKTAAVEAVTSEGDVQVGKVQEAAAEIVADREQIQQNKTNIAALTNKTNTLAPGIVLNAKGGAIAVHNASDQPFVGLKVYGKSEQFKTTGAQLFDAAEAEMNAILDMDGTTSANGNINTSGFVKVSPNTKYSVSSTRQNRGKFYDRDKQVLTTDKFDFELSNNKDRFSTPENVEYVRFSIYGTEDLGTLMMNAGETLKPWEVYTGGKPSPSPEYPQDIVNAGDAGEINVNIGGKNLLPYHLMRTGTEYGLTLEYLEDEQCFVLNGTTTHASRSYFSAFINLPGVKGSYYTISTTHLGGEVIIPEGSYDYSVFYLGSNDLENTSANWLSTDLHNKDKTSTRALSHAYITSMWLYITDGVTYNNYKFRIQLEEGKVASPWEPYKKQTLTLATPNGLAGIPVKSGGNYVDETGQQWITDEIDCDREVKIQRIEKCKVNHEVVTYNPSTGYASVSGIKKADVNHLNAAMCTHLITKTGAHFWIDSTGKNFRFKVDAFSTEEEYKEFFRNNNVEVAYVLAEMAETPLTPEEIAAYKALHTYSPNTTVTNDGGCGMAVEYVADTKTYIKAVEDKITAIQAALISQKISGGV